MQKVDFRDMQYPA